MKVTATTLLAIAALAAAAPTEIKYDAPAGGWDSIEYPKGTGQGPDAVPEGGWDSVKYPPGTGVDPTACPPAVGSPFKFTSTYHIKATPDQVVNGTTPTGGLAGASGTYDLGIDTYTNTLCYNITIYNFRGNYQSPALTATHIHEAAYGASGPPRFAFPNPVGDGEIRRSIGCVTGPFKTGVLASGVDTGSAFHVRQIEANPAGFFADVHSSLAVAGAVRGQLA